ncbi:N-acetylmuramoyl-L-alanine amidase [Clostridium sp. D53t1_180928_C8]|uniref:peptidoglycan recognition protein family protein n=1 Tax=Clostridium sp. D53t1_180928_C8 TaxID=2787101 RepID=UPI0018AB18DE|nr:N-acetylmuramoyl-L-alanine amidase [Clostridium sp. D53t1_180928_C8]
MLPIQRKISSYNYSSRNGDSVKYIILHYTGNKGDTAKNNVYYFYNGDKSASAHYFVDDTSIWQSVEEYNAAWSVGDGNGVYGITNKNSINIEMCCNINGVISEITENNALELVKYLQKKYNLPNNNVVRHYDASHKICPNWSDNNWSRWDSFKNKLQKISK